MKKIRLLILLQVFFSISIFSQGWVFQNPKPQGNDLRSVNFFDRNNGWAVGAAGMIIHTSNGGTNWDVQNSNTTNYLYSVKAISATTAIVTGEMGIILRTTNGGMNWTSYTSSVNTILIAQYFINAQVGFVVPLLTGNLLKTIDGGLTWTTIQTGITYGVMDICFINDNVGFIATGDTFSIAGIFRTDDGGNTWVSQSIPTTYGFNGICARDTVAWAVGYDGVILKTINNTKKWISSVPGNVLTYSLNGVDFFNKNIGIAVGEMGETKRTTDQGNTWTLLMEDYDQNKTINKVQMIDDSYGFLVGNKGKIMKTTDGGLTWKHVDNDIKPTFWSVWFTDTNNGVAVGDSSTSAGGYTDAKVFSTTDGGNNWVLRQSIINATLLGVHFPTKSTGYAVGFNGSNAIYSKTINNGLTWTSGVINNFKGRLWSVFFYDANSGIAVGDSGIVMKTTDGGDSWARKISNTSNNLFYVHFTYNILTNTPPADTGYIAFAVGGSGAYYKSKDYGESWNPITTPMSNYSIYGIHAVPRKVIWLVGSSNNIYKSTATGTFVKQILPSSLYANWIGVYASDENNACVIGEYGDVVVTTDGGNTWQSQIATKNNLNAVHFENKNVGWIVGEGGTILYTSNGGNIVEVKRDRQSNVLPSKYVISQNYPNPFNPTTTINFSVPKTSFVTIKVYDVLGREVITLVNENKPVGNYIVQFNASKITSGIYFYRMESGSFSETKKLLLLK